LENLQMKKTLIAVAALAATSAFAQVTISGYVAMGYASQATGAVGSTKDASGFGIDSTNLAFTATEDLGAGMSLKTSLNMGAINRAGNAGSGNVQAKDASMALTTSMGVLALATSESTDYLGGGLAGQGVWNYGWAGVVFSGVSTRDRVSFTAPVGPVSLNVAFAENSGLANAGLGKGNSGDAPAANSQSVTSVAATYVNGPLALNGAYAAYGNTKTILNAVDAVSLSGNYNLGAFKVGAGTQIVTYTPVTGKAAPVTNDYALSVTAPLGANLSVGAQAVSRTFVDLNTSGGTNGTVTGYAAQANYSLSKRTGLLANYATWYAPAATGPTAGLNASTRMELLLTTSF
jgi:hypothetical protein